MPQRFRENGAFYSASAVTKWWYESPVVVTSGPSTFTRDEVHGNTRKMWDYVTPNFRKLMEEGQIINNPMTLIETTRTIADQGWKFSWVGGGKTYFGECDKNWMAYSYGTPALPNWPNTDNLVAEASTKAHAKVQAGDFQGLVSAAELGKTLKMLVKPGASIRKIVNNWWKSRNGKNLNWTSPLDVAEAAAGSWLEYRYGWRIAMIEIEGLLEALGGVAKPRSTARGETRDKTEWTVNTTGTNSNVIIPIYTDYTVQVRIRAGILYDNESSYGSYGWGVRASDIPAALWDLVPYSFVIDWAINMNAFMNAWTYKEGTNQLATWLREDVTLTSRRRTGPATFSNWTTQRSPNAVDTHVLKSVRRVPGIPGPSLAFRSGTYKRVFGTVRAADGIALLFQQLTRSFTSRK